MRILIAVVPLVFLTAAVIYNGVFEKRPKYRLSRSELSGVVIGSILYGASMAYFLVTGDFRALPLSWLALAIIAVSWAASMKRRVANELARRRMGARDGTSPDHGAESSRAAAADG